MIKNNYYSSSYDTVSRWMSYWHQIKEILALSPKDVLEIGVGNKTVYQYLKAQGLNVVSLDSNEALKPDFTADVLRMPFKDNAFDAVLCAEVLEHLPFKDLDGALREIKRVARKNAVLSLPHFGPQVKFGFKIPFLGEKRLAFKIPLAPTHKFNSEHHWEIGKRGYSTSAIQAILKRHFKIKKEFIPFENQYHHFFILEK